MNSGLPIAPACERNKQPILDALMPRLPERGAVLEIGSCTGQHVVHFAPVNPRLTWQPSDRDEHLPGLAARIRAEGSLNILLPVELDVEKAWPDKQYQAVFSANTAHIMKWAAVRAMFRGVGRVLGRNGPFFLYGPFHESGRATSASNADFDRDLRAQDPAMGLRDVDDLADLAQQFGLRQVERLPMPANNQLLVYRKQGSGNNDAAEAGG